MDGPDGRSRRFLWPWRMESVMAWSTSELAELAGTTVNTVRHYHRSGLLEQPERMSNGYKQYGARHLVRLLQIRRLRDIGVPLAQIESVGFSGQTPAAALLSIDADLAVSIERLQRARAEIRAILEGTTATDVPAGFEHLAGRLSRPERSLMLVYSQLYDESAMADLKTMVEAAAEDASVEFDALPPEADDATRKRLADSLAPQLAQHLIDYPWLTDPAGHLSRGPKVTQETFLETVVELYNESQLDVLARASVIARELVAEQSAGRRTWKVKECRMADDLDPRSAGGDTARLADGPLLVEDVLLLLFQPDSGTIAGENILFYVLGGAVLGDLALAERVEVRKHGALSTRVHAIGDASPSDEILASALSYVAEKPRNVQTVLAAVGPYLRQPVLDRLVERGDVNREEGKALGIFPTTKLTLGSGRRAELMAQARAALIDGETPEPRIGASIALLSASGTLPQFYREIPWSGDVYTRDKDLERGDWGATAAADAVTRTMAAVIANAVVAATILPRA